MKHWSYHKNISDLLISETRGSNNWIPQIVRERVPDRRDSETETQIERQCYLPDSLLLVQNQLVALLLSSRARRPSQNHAVELLVSFSPVVLYVVSWLLSTLMLLSVLLAMNWWKFLLTVLSVTIGNAMFVWLQKSRASSHVIEVLNRQYLRPSTSAQSSE